MEQERSRAKPRRIPPPKVGQNESKWKWRTKQKLLRTNYQSRLFNGFAFLALARTIWPALFRCGLVSSIPFYYFFCNFSVSTVCQLHFSTGPHSNGFLFGVCWRWPASSFNATVSTICWVAPRRQMCVQLRLTFTQVNGPNSDSLGRAKWPSRQFFEGARQPSPFAPLNIYVIGLKFPFGSRKNCTAVWPQWIVRSQPDTSESWPAHGVYSMPYPISCPNLQLHLHTRIKNLEQLQHSFPFAQPQWVLSR